MTHAHKKQRLYLKCRLFRYWKVWSGIIKVNIDESKGGRKCSKSHVVCVTIYDEMSLREGGSTL